MDGAARAERGRAWGQGLRGAAAGVGPLLHVPSREALTGQARERRRREAVGELAGEEGR